MANLLITIFSPLLKVNILKLENFIITNKNKHMATIKSIIASEMFKAEKIGLKK
jgi:hypothetical protein